MAEDRQKKSQPAPASPTIEVPKKQERKWDPFTDGLARGTPGTDADFDIGMNRPPWEGN